MAKLPSIGPHNFVRQLCRHNEEALVYVAREYGGIIRTVISRQLSQNSWLESRESYTEECMNDVLLAIWQNADCYDPKQSSFENWVAGISRHKAMDCIRRRLRRPQTVSLEELPIASEAVVENAAEMEIEALLESLTEKDRRLFVLRYLEGQPIEEIAVQMGLKPEAVYNRISRGRKRIQKELGLTHRSQ